MSQRVTFAEVPIGETFWWGGNECVKRSTRTATIVRYERWFYFGQNETVTF